MSRTHSNRINGQPYREHILIGAMGSPIENTFYDTKAVATCEVRMRDNDVRVFHLLFKERAFWYVNFFFMEPRIRALRKSMWKCV